MLPTKVKRREYLEGGPHAADALRGSEINVPDVA